MDSMRNRARIRAPSVMVIVAILVAMATLILLWRRPGDSDHAGAADSSAALARLPVASRVARTLGSREGPTWEAIAAALDEELLPAPSDVRVVRLETDEERVCAGRPAWLHAVVDGRLESGVVQRWLWADAERRVTLEPGGSIRWTAPEPGRYQLLFQVCRSEGGKRVAVLAEKTMAVEVIDCGGAQAPLAIDADEKDGFGMVEFVARARVATTGGFTWNFGDGELVTTEGSRVRRTYPVEALEIDQDQAWRVQVETRTPSGATLRAGTTLLVHGAEPPELRVSLADAVWNESEDRWERPILVVNRGRPPIEWTRLERTIEHWNGRIETHEHVWDQRILTSQPTGDGGFTGEVVVRADEARPEVRRIRDRLFGLDESGVPVELSWAPYRADQTSEPEGALGG